MNLANTVMSRISLAFSCLFFQRYFPVASLFDSDITVGSHGDSLSVVMASNKFKPVNLGNAAFKNVPPFSGFFH